jgi:hypothetical protein
MYVYSNPGTYRTMSPFTNTMQVMFIVTASRILKVIRADHTQKMAASIRLLTCVYACRKYF